MGAMTHFAACALSGAFAGCLGSMVGLGGGIFVVPVLTLFLGATIHQAVAASLVAVIATSSVAAIAYTRDELSNVRLGMVLETATTAGALAGGLLASRLERRTLSAVFAAVLVLNALYLLLKHGRREAPPEFVVDIGALGGRYNDFALGREVRYRVRRVPLGLAVSALAGAVSGMLGIGGGPIKVPLMTGFMGVPMKAAAATSNFMIGVTACASGVLYYRLGHVSPALAVPTALGVSAGALAGSRLGPRLSGERLVRLLAAVLAVLAVKMTMVAAGVGAR